MDGREASIVPPEKISKTAMHLTDYFIVGGWTLFRYVLKLF